MQHRGSDRGAGGGEGEVMSGDIFGIIVLTVVLTVVYLIIGIGAARMVSAINERDFSLVDILLWPAVLIVYAVVGDAP